MIQNPKFQKRPIVHGCRRDKKLPPIKYKATLIENQIHLESEFSKFFFSLFDTFTVDSRTGKTISHQYLKKELVRLLGDEDAKRIFTKAIIIIG